MTVHFEAGMKQQIELRKNGTYQLVVRSKDGIDTIFLEAMATSAGNNPTSLHMTYKDGEAIISVDIQ